MKNVKTALWFITASLFLSLALTSTAVAQISPVQAAINSSVQSSQSQDPITVVPFEFDPFGTNLVRARWMTGLGCPTGATTNNGSSSGTETDAACTTGDSKDKQNEGLLLAKTGPTPNFAASGAKLEGVKGTVLTELGYDVRKPMSATDPRGSHCGAGAPRFNVVTSDGVLHFVGCNSPPAMLAGSSASWIRLRWFAAQLLMAFPPILPGSTVSSITIIFDEGTDTGPDNFGLAVLDNIDVNGTLAGRGPGS